MPDDDIYGNKGKYERFKDNLNNYLTPPKETDRKRKYWIKNKINIKYFKKMFDKFDARDNSYIRRLRLLRSFLIVAYVLDKDLSKVDRDDIDKVMGFAHTVNKSVKSKRDFALDTKFIWRQIFPELDEKGRPDETLVPYAVRHLSGKVDKSREKMRKDKYTLEEFKKLMDSFSNDPRMQCLLTTIQESLSRPQEILGRKIKDVEMHDNYAKIYITEHGKEGVGFLRIIDSYFYLSKWINSHPLKSDPEAYLFINLGKVNHHKQFKPKAANEMISDRCKKIGINKPITLYSLKRNGVTMMRLAGKSDVEIQHTARWTSTKQLRTYDLSTQEDSFRLELIKRGKIKLSKEEMKKHKNIIPQIKVCGFCDYENGISETFCQKCKRPLNRDIIEKQYKKKEKELDGLKLQMNTMQQQMAQIAEAIIKKEKPTIAEVEAELKRRGQKL